MKITAGIGGIRHYRAMAESGADECFMGYVPMDWLEKYANITPLNRREVIMQDMQAGSMAEMRLLAAMVRDTGVPVALTFNSPAYRPDQYPFILNMLDALGEIGFADIIIADPALLLRLNAAHYPGHIHLSGEAGVFNAEAMQLFGKMNIARWIFPRKISPEEMAECISLNPGCEYEAFALNELCHYSGAYCMSLHCDEMSHACCIPYLPTGKDCESAPETDDNYPPDGFGAGGCALCALGKLQDAGITHLKIVGRGANTENMLRDVRIMRAACEMFSRGETDLHSLLPDGRCSGLCYYN
ncbi:MAG: U32 family peptidase [Clostridia bacterium]|nr:U32 family peptidase [Clostridia bacterium]